MSRFSSRLHDFLALKRALGFRYIHQGRMVLHLDRFIDAQSDQPTVSFCDLLLRWRKSAKTLQSEYDRLKISRSLCAYMRRFDGQIRIPPPDSKLEAKVRQSRRIPFILTCADMKHLLATARGTSYLHSPWRPNTMRIMLLLLFCTGMRVGELQSLRLEDFDRKNGLLTIRETKFFKSRVIPLSESLRRELRRYLDYRRTLKASQQPRAPLVWNPHRRCGYQLTSIEDMLSDLFRVAGFKPGRGRDGLHVHDLRHSFATTKLLDWYRQRMDVNARLPYLSTYLGHVKVSSTQIYLATTQDLLQEANQRFYNRYCGVFGAQA